MLIKIEVRTDGGTLLTLPLTDYSEGYTIEDLTGLDPVKATLVYSSFAQQDGTDFQSAQRGNRDLVLKIGFQPNYVSTTALNLRQRLYGFFMPKSNVRLRFYEDTGLTVEIAGRIESFDSPRFTKEPDATIGITCFSPDFVDLTRKSFTGNTTAGTTQTSLTYLGTVETGFNFLFFPNRAMSGFTMYNTSEDGVQRSFQLTVPIIANDTISFSTVPGGKGVTLNRLGISSSILYGVSPSSNWLNLFPGINKLRVLASGVAIPWNIYYADRYGGL